jgi:hypothetical protein
MPKIFEGGGRKGGLGLSRACGGRGAAQVSGSVGLAIIPYFQIHLSVNVYLNLQ